MHIHFITTGGTIDKVYFDAANDYHIGPPQVLEVLQEAHVTFSYEIEPVLAKDSLELTDEDRQTILKHVRASACERIVITHGTDTMVQTALLLRTISHKTIVLTGAMQPARFRTSDATFNIGMAIGAVTTLPAGVYVAMSGRVFDPANARKDAARQCFVEISGPAAGSV